MPARRHLHLLLILLGLVAAFPAAAVHLTPEGEELIVRYEVGGKPAYIKKYQRPVCPACLTTASGVTFGIGVDLRHSPYSFVKTTWSHHPQLPRLLKAHGLGGQAAVNMTRQLQDVITPWPMAIDHFRNHGIVPYRNLARRTFGPEFDFLSKWAQDALVSLVYNRGGSLKGPSRVEMKTIKDVCVKLWQTPEVANGCIARQLRTMVRVWKGSTIEVGMARRRFDEATLALFSR